MDDYIRREDASNWLKQYGQDVLHGKYKFSLMYIWKNIIDLPPADVVPVVHAYWIPQKENNEFKEAWMKCSACGYPVSRWTGNTNFCPNCGADMRGEQDDRSKS